MLQLSKIGVLFSYRLTLRNASMFTLSDLSLSTGATVKSWQLDDVVLSIKKARNMFFSGDVLFHLTVKADGQGLNNTGTWPAYLVSDNGKLKVVFA